MYTFLRHPLGWLLKSTEYLAAREIRRWFRTNPHMREIGYSGARRLLMRLSDVPLGTSLTLLVLQGATMGAVLYFHFRINVPVDGTAPEQIKELSNHLSMLLQVQATVAALTFPMVIALVTFLFGTKDSGGGRRHMVYLADSCAMLIGVSSMFLVLVMLVEDRAIWGFSPNTLSWLLTLDYIWCAINVTGTIYFLRQSLRFVDPSTRAGIISKYMFSVVWPGQARALYKAFSLLASNQDKEMAPDGIDQFFFGGMWAEFGKVAVTRTFARNHYLADVNFRTLNLAIWLWKLKLGPQETKKARKSWSSASQDPKLVFPLAYGTPFTGKVTLCKVIGEVHPGFVSRLLIWLSFCFTRKAPALDPLVVDSVITEMEAEAIDLVNAHRRRQFEDKCDEIVEFLGELFLSSEYEGDNGEKGNFALLPRNMVWGMPIYQRWIWSFIEIADAVIPSLKESPEYFRHLAHVPQRLLYWTRYLSQSDFARDSISLGLSLFMRLEMWWARTIEEQGVADHGMCKPDVLRPPFFATQAELLREFIGAFEGIRNYILDDPNEMKMEEWPKATMHTRLHVTHLSQVVQMLSYAVNLGDRKGAEAAGDMLQRWSNPIKLRQVGAYYSPDRTWRYAFLDVTGQPLEDVKKQADIADEYDEYQGNRIGAFIANALENTWADYQAVVIYTLLRWSMDCSCESSLPADIARKLMYGTAISPNAGTPAGSLRGIKDRGELLAAILRQQRRDRLGDINNKTTYNDHLGGVFDEIHRINEERMVSGRTYGGWGSRDLDTTLDVQALWLAIFPGNWEPAKQMQKYVESLVAEDNDHAENLKRFFTQMLERVNSPEFDKQEKVFNCIRDLDGSDEFRKAREEVRAGLEAIVKLFSERLTAAVVEAEIDPKRLQAIESFASNLAFATDTGEAPLQFFQKVAYSPSVDHTFLFRILNMDRGGLVTPLRAPLAGNEQEWYEMTTRDAVSGSIMREVITKTDFQVVDTATPQTYWEELKRLAQTIRDRKLTPILLLENQNSPKWVWDWAFEHRYGRAWVPSDLRAAVDRPHEQQHGYRFTLNEVPAYQVPMPPGASILLPREYFKSITFREYGQKRYVSVETEPADNVATRVNLLLRWGHDIELNADLKGLVTKLTYSTNEQEQVETYPSIDV